MLLRRYKDVKKQEVKQVEQKPPANTPVAAAKRGRRKKDDVNG